MNNKNFSLDSYLENVSAHLVINNDKKYQSERASLQKKLKEGSRQKDDH